MLALDRFGSEPRKYAPLVAKLIDNYDVAEAFLAFGTEGRFPVRDCVAHLAMPDARLHLARWKEAQSDLDAMWQTLSSLPHLPENLSSAREHARSAIAKATTLGGGAVWDLKAWVSTMVAVYAWLSLAVAAARAEETDAGQKRDEPMDGQRVLAMRVEALAELLNRYIIQNDHLVAMVNDARRRLSIIEAHNDALRDELSNLSGRYAEVKGLYQQLLGMQAQPAFDKKRVGWAAKAVSATATFVVGAAGGYVGNIAADQNSPLYPFGNETPAEVIVKIEQRCDAVIEAADELPDTE